MIAKLHTSRILYVIPALLLLSVFFLFPIVRLFFVSLGFGNGDLSLDAYTRLFANSVFLKSLYTTVVISGLVTTIAVLIGYPVAYALATTRGRWQTFIGLAVLLPFWASILVRNYAWVHLLRRRGAFNDLLINLGFIDQPIAFIFNESGVVIGMTNALLPFMVLPIFVALQSQNKLLIEAAGSLGARPLSAFLTVTLPLSLNGIFAGSLIVFATALGFFVTPALLGGGKVLMTATYISREIETYLDWPLAAAASMILLFFVTALITLYARLVSVDRIVGMGDTDA